MNEPTKGPTYKDDPFEIAEYLEKIYGCDRAIELVRDGIIKSQQDGDNYALSIWRKV